jgi:TolB-like protein/DNA-binding winged helix-turn-helix (wHTH) protein/Tfp pilus assembly protein PilF
VSEIARPPNVVRFGVFELELQSGRLRKHGLKVKLQEKPFQVLTLLLERPGEVVTREELRRQLWPADTFVDFDHSVNTAVNKLREALGDSAESPRFIETLPRHGYRFIAGVEAVAPVYDRREAPALTERRHEERPAVPSFVRAGGGRRYRGRIAALAAGGVAAILSALVGLNVAGLRGRLAAAVGAGHGAALPKIESIAVLPLENLSGDPEQEYFAEGMTDELITTLGQVSALRVISRTSVMRYKDTKEPLPQIARELNVDAIVEGTVRSSGDRVRITANLLYAPTDRHLWSEIYERDQGDVLALQSDVARAIVKQIRVKVTPQEQVRLASARPVNPEAHRLYLLGRFYWNKRTEEGFKKAIGLFQRAIEINPAYAPAYAGVADSYNLLGDYACLRPRHAYPKAKAAARKALQIDEASAEAHTSLAYVHFEYDWDWASCEKEFERAIQLSPNYATAHQWYSEYLSTMRKHAEAVAEGQRAQQLDPLSPVISTCLAARYFFMRQYDRQIRALRETASVFPEFAATYGELGRVYVTNGMYQEAISAFQKQRSLSGASPAEVAALGQAYAKGGIRGYYLWELRRLREEAKHRYVRAVAFARVFTHLGDKDQAFSYLEKAYEDRDWRLALLQINPLWDPLRSDPRFQDILRRMNFPR